MFEKLPIDWTLSPGKFNNYDVLVIIHKPTKSAHMDDNMTKFAAQENFHNNQMRKLKQLQHKNIVKLFSYQEHCIPQFYIVEDYLKNNLQVGHYTSKVCCKTFLLAKEMKWKMAFENIVQIKDITLISRLTWQVIF